MKDLLLAFLSKTLNMDGGEVASLLFNDEDGSEIKEDALKALLAKDKDRISGIKEESSEKFDEGYSKAKKEVMSKVEKDLKETFGVDSDKKGTELFEFIKTETTKKSKENGGSDDLDPDEIKKTKTYQDGIEAERTKYEEKYNEVKTEFDEYKNKVQREKSLTSVKSRAAEIFDSMGVVLSENEDVAKNQRKVFLELIEKGNYKVEGDRIIMLDDEGKVLEDDHGHQVHFDDHVKTRIKSMYDIKKAKKRQSGKPDGEGGAGDEIDRSSWNWDGTKITSEDEFNKLASKATSVDEKKALLDSYNEFVAADND